MTIEPDNDTATRCGDVCDADSGLPRVLDSRCATCIFRPGNLMGLAPGARSRLVADALAHNSWIVCHSTLPDTGNPIGTQAICRGFWDRYRRDSWGCRLTVALGGPIPVPPPEQTAPDTSTEAEEGDLPGPRSRP